MNLFDPSEAPAPRITPGHPFLRFVFDLGLGLAIGLGAASTAFVYGWMQAKPLETETTSSVGLVFIAIIAGGPLVAMAAQRLLKLPHSVITFGARASLILGLIWIAYAVSVAGQRLLTLANKEFVTLFYVAASASLVWCVSLPTAWREARSRMLPWAVSAVVLWTASEWVVDLGPAIQYPILDPRIEIAFVTLAGCGVFLMCGILAFMDRRISAGVAGADENG